MGGWVDDSPTAMKRLSGIMKLVNKVRSGNLDQEDLGFPTQACPVSSMLPNYLHSICQESNNDAYEGHGHTIHRPRAGGISYTVTVILGSTPEARSKHPSNRRCCRHSRESMTSRASQRGGGLVLVPTGSKATLF